MKTKSVSRRRFLTSAAMAGSALAMSRSSWGNVRGANERVRFALIGCGGRGKAVTLTMLGQGGNWSASVI